jgi:iron(III) transport system permease protein
VTRPKRKPLTGKRLRNLVLNVLTNPFNMIVFISLIVLICLIIIPLLQMVQTTFTLAQSELRRVDGQVGDFTLYYWKQLFASNLSSALLWQPLRNSLLVGIITAVISVPLGSLLAWLMVRSDLPGKDFIGMLIIIPYMIPSWCKSMSWLAMFRNGRSGTPGFLHGLGIPIPDWLAYGPVAIVLVMTLHYYAFSYIMVSSSLRSVNSELEEMGEIQGASKIQILRHITLPLVTPAVLSSTIMTLSKSVGSFGVAANLGMRIGYFTLSTKMHDAINNRQAGFGYAMAILLIVMASGTIFANQRMVGTRKSYETMGGKGTKHTPMPLGKAKKPLLIFLAVFLLLAMVLPMLILILETFQVSTGSGYGRDNLTLYNWIGEMDPNSRTNHTPGIFRNPVFINALWNTVKLTIVSSIITAFS